MGGQAPFVVLQIGFYYYTAISHFRTEAVTIPGRWPCILPSVSS